MLELLKSVVMSLENEINKYHLFLCLAATESHYFNITYQSHEEMISFQSILVEPSDCIQSLYEICSSVFFLQLFEFRNNLLILISSKRP
jgi:hypothetical protein